MILLKIDRSRVIAGVSASSIVGTVSLVASLALFPLIVSVIGPAPYGVWLFLVGAASFTYYADLGIGNALVHFTSRKRGGDNSLEPDKMLASSILFMIAACLLTLTLFLIVAINYLDTSEAASALSGSNRWIICGLASLIVAGIVFRPFSAALIGHGMLVQERRTQMVALGVRVVGTMAVCLAAPSLINLAAVEAAAIICPGLFAGLTCRRMGISSNFRDAKLSEVRRLLAFSSRSFAVNALGALTLQAGTILTGLLGTPSQVTAFNAAFKVYMSVRQLVGWVTDPFRSVFSRLYATPRGEGTRFELILVSTCLSLTLFGGTFLTIISAPFLRLWLGSQPGMPIGEIQITMVILLAGLTLNSLHMPLAALGDAAGRPGIFLTPQAFWLFGYVALAVPLYNALGIRGIAVAMTVPLVIVEPLYLVLARKFIDYDSKDIVWRVLFRSSVPTLLSIVLAGSLTLLCKEVLSDNFKVGEMFLYAIAAFGFAVFWFAYFATLGRRQVREVQGLMNLSL